MEFYTDIDSEKLWTTQNLAAPAGASNSSGPAGFTTPAAVAEKGDGQDGPPKGAPPKGGPGGPPPPPMGDPTEKGNYYEGYSENYMPVFVPEPPQPYCIWEDTTAH